MKTKNKWIILFLMPTVIIFLLIYVIPLFMVFGISLTNSRLSSKTVSFIGLDNYLRMFGDPAFFLALRNTLLWIFIHCVFHVALGVFLAMLLYKKPRGWKFVRTAYMVPSIIANAAIGTIFLNIYNPQIGVLNSLLRLVGLGKWEHNWLMETNTAYPAVTVIWFIFAGYTTTLVLAEALAIDQSVLEAARVDGAKNWQIDLCIMLPMLRRIIGTTMIMAAIYMLQMFDIIYITTSGGPGKTTTNLPLLLYSVYKNENNYGYSNTIGVVIILLGVLVMNIISRVMRMNQDDD